MWLLVGVEGLLRVVCVFGGGAGGAVWLGVGWVSFLRRYGFFVVRLMCRGPCSVAWSEGEY